MQDNNFGLASCFFVHFFAVTARRRLEDASLFVVWRAQISDVDFFLLFLNLSVVPKKRTRENSPTFHIFSELVHLYTRQSLKKRKFLLKVTLSLPWP